MKSVSAMELRHHLGELLDEVRLLEKPILIKRAGKPIAVLGPVEEKASAEDMVERRLSLIKEVSTRYRVSKRGRDAQEWVENQRGDRV